MPRILLAVLLAALAASPLSARVVVFSETGFPTVDSQPVSKSTLQSALGSDLVFAGLEDLQGGHALDGADLLVLPYGSAVPVAAWPQIDAYLRGGGNLLVVGGQPLHVPVTGSAGAFTAQQPQDTFSRALGFLHTYTAPTAETAHFTWRDGYSFFPSVEVKAQHCFVVEGRQILGLGYLEGAEGTRLAAPVIASDRAAGPMLGARVVALDFDPQPGYWESADGISLLRSSAGYARQGATSFSIEAQFSTVRPAEPPQLTLHLRLPRQVPKASDEDSDARVELLRGTQLVSSADVALHGSQADADIPFHSPLPAGFYTVRAVWSSAGHAREFATNGFNVEDVSALESGPVLGVKGDFLSLDGKPFFPVGTNYFSTESNGWDFSGPRNAQVWEEDFADMERHGVSFVRTGVWMSNSKFVEQLTGEVNERFLRNFEAYLAAAQRHHIVVNFTFYAFVPHVGDFQRGGGNTQEPPPPNPYLDAGMLRAEHAYVTSVVRRFARVPWLCYDLINEPSFSNPRVVFHGNVPNGDPAESGAWHKWLKAHYGQSDALAAAWSVPPSEVGNFDAVPLPEARDMNYDRYGNAHQVRALDYNLFAQDSFSGWVRGMVQAIHEAGSSQVINIGQDEGGVTDRVLNQFYATSGVSFTTNHTYWQDDALLWDSVAAKRPGIPNITGETGYQPVWAPDGTWRYDELTGLALEERKWVLGFAAGSSGALQWDWDREVDFGMERSDGSAKLWENMMRDLGAFARDAAPYATGWQAPQVAIVLPQSLQLSVYNSEALAAQQTAVRVLHMYNHIAAYAVGEYQLDTLGSPRLIVLPSPMGLTTEAWSALLDHVRDGSVLLVTGPFDGDAHLHPSGRIAALGLKASTIPLELREETLRWPGSPLALSYGGLKTTTLSRLSLAGGSDWAEIPLGKGRILISSLPLELNDRLDPIAEVYAYALKAAQVEPAYTTTIRDHGILICPTLLPHATLYALTSESNSTQVAFHDVRSNHDFIGELPPGRSALLLVGEDGKPLARYHWNPK